MRLAFDAEAAGANFGIAGAMLLALAIPQSRWAWCLLLGSNICWLLFAHQHQYKKLLRQTLVFTASSLLGILNSFLPGNPVQAWLTKHFSYLLGVLSSFLPGDAAQVWLTTLFS